MSTDFNKPVATDGYASLLAGIQTAMVDLVRQLEPSTTGTHTNVPTGAVRFNAAGAMWEQFNGTSWVALASVYNITVANATNATNWAGESVLAAVVAGKADATATANALATKADAGAVSTALAGKADTSTVNTALATKADTSAVNTALATKADTSALAAKADLASPSFTGNPTAPTQATADQSTRIASTAYVAAKIPAALNAGGSAPIFGARAWVNFNGVGTVAIRASGNVSSITDNGAGDYTVNFTTAMQDGNYCAPITCGSTNIPGYPRLYPANMLASSVRFLAVNGDNNAVTDMDALQVAIFR